MTPLEEYLSLTQGTTGVPGQPIEPPPGANPLGALGEYLSLRSGQQPTQQEIAGMSPAGQAQAAGHGWGVAAPTDGTNAYDPRSALAHYFDVSGQPAPGPPTQSDWNLLATHYGLQVPEPRQVAAQPGQDTGFTPVRAGDADAPPPLDTSMSAKEPSAQQLAGIQGSAAAPENPAHKTLEEGAQKVADVQARQALAEQQALIERGKQLEQERGAEMLAQSHEAEMLQGLRSRVDKANEAIQQPEAKLDPGRWYANQSTGGKVATWISLVMGGIGAAGVGVATHGREQGRNGALDMMMGAIDRDLNIQREELQAGRQRKQSALSGSLTALQLAQGAVKDNQSQRLLARSMMAESAANQLEQTLAGSKSEMAKANGELELGKIRLQAQQDREAAIAREHARAMAEGTLGVAISNAATTRQHVENEATKATDLAQKERLKDYVPGVGFTRPGYSDKVAEAQRAHSKLADILTRIDKHAETEGWTAPLLETTATGRGDSLRGQLIGAIKQADQLGALDTGVQTLADLESGGHPNQWNTAKFRAAVQELRRSMQTDWKTYLKTNVPQPEAPSAVQQAFRPVGR